MKKKLEDLKVGDCFYIFDWVRWAVTEENLIAENCWRYVRINNDFDIWQLNKRLKHARLFVALDEEEIKNKVLD